ncbi:DHA2 family efflux MFS transporter permease subunit [Acidiphilium multivorum]|uniref:DHA2 family efflux MFS transporter permease subunit n=1 Tax=Acidiphilium multivorum TaxID=62140 RepID=UPI0039C9D294
MLMPRNQSTVEDHLLRPGSPVIWLVTLGTMLATLMQSLDTTIANVSLPYMAGTFAVSYDQVTWVLTTYIVAAAIMTPPTGWLAATFGRRRLFILSVLGFTAASALCGLSQSLATALLSRLIQGISGAALVPLSQATLLDTYPRERHGQAMAIWGMGVVVGPILGPILGGWLTQNWSWRWVYFINLPVGLVAATVIAANVRETSHNRGSRFDFFGFGTISLAIACFQIVLDRGQLLDWFASPEIVALSVLGGISLYIFLIHAFTAQDPFIRPDLFRNANFTIGVTFAFLIGLVLYGTMALFPPLLQNLLDFPVVTVGMLLAPRGVGMMITMMGVGRLTNRLSPKLLIASGLLVSSYAMWGMAGFSMQIGPWNVFVWGVIQGIGFGLIWVSITTTAFATLPAQRRTEAAGIYSLLRNIGSSVGIAALTTLVTRYTQINHADLGANITPFDRILQQPPYVRLYNPSTLSGAALLNTDITRHASMISYIDAFRLMMILSLTSLPLVLFIRRRRENR